VRVIAYSQLSDVRQEVEFAGDLLRIGRDPANDLELPSPFVSREHARLLKHDGEYFIENVGLNGTLVGEHLVGVSEQVRIACCTWWPKRRPAGPRARLSKSAEKKRPSSRPWPSKRTSMANSCGG